MKRVILVHGWEGNPEKNWFVWLRKELEKRGFTVIVPAMPNTMNPTMNAWVPHLSKTAGIPDQDAYFVGHSVGCITILRYLETLQNNQKVGGTVLVAGLATIWNMKDTRMNSQVSSKLPLIGKKLKSTATNL